MGDLSCVVQKNGIRSTVVYMIVQLDPVIAMRIHDVFAVTGFDDAGADPEPYTRWTRVPCSANKSCRTRRACWPCTTGASAATTPTSSCTIAANNL